MEKPEKTSWRVRGAVAGLNETARASRHEPTPVERVLWEALRSRKLDGLKFRRQYPVGKFILDFYCAEHHLAVEVDGEIHRAQAEHDAERTRMLNEFGIQVIRFSNQDVLTKLPQVLASISEAANPQSKHPSPKIGRGAGGEGND